MVEGINMSNYNIVEADFEHAGVTATASRKMWQWDNGVILHITGLDLPPSYQIHISNDGLTGTAQRTVVTGEYIGIPSSYFESGKTVYCFLYLTGEDYGVTRRTVIINVRKRPMPEDWEPTPDEQTVLDQLIAALNVGVTRSETAADHAETSEDNAKASEDNAQTYMERAESARDRAVIAESNAQASEANAAASALGASDSATDARQSELNAMEWADKAEQSAGQSGYMWFYIEDGDLYMDKTSNVDVDFYLQDGDLYVTD